MKITREIFRLVIKAYLIAFELLLINYNFDWGICEENGVPFNSISSDEIISLQPSFPPNVKPGFNYNFRNDNNKHVFFFPESYNLNNLSCFFIIHNENDSTQKNKLLVGINPRSPPYFS